MIEFTDVEVLLERLARDASEDADLVQVCVEVYFMNIRVQLDGKEAAHGKLERFLSGASLPGSQRQHWLTVAMGSALIVTLGAVIVNTKFLNGRLY